MGFLDRLFGRGQQRQPQYYQQGYPQQGYPQHGSPAPYGVPPAYGQQPRRGPQDRPGTADEQAIRRYQYLLQTAPPDRIEQAHAEAFEQLTPQQRQLVLQQLATVNPDERPADDSPQSLARYATRTEMRRPGTLTRTLGTAGGVGMGGMLLSTMAGAFIGTAIASELFDNDGFMDWDTSGGSGGGEAVAGGEQFAGGDTGYDNVGYDNSGYDGSGGDFGGSGGDFGDGGGGFGDFGDFGGF